MSALSRKLDFLFEPVSPASLGVFRVCFGALMLWHLSSVMPYFTETLPTSRFFLTYDLFHWVSIMPPAGMTALFYTLLAAAFLVMVGAAYRPAIVVFCLGWTYVLLLGRGHYNNHSYLFSLIAFLLAFSSAARWVSVDTSRRHASGSSIPYWQIFLLKAQIFLVYFYAGIAKLTPDWLEGYPMKIWLARKADATALGRLLETDFAAYAFSYGGLVFDLAVGFLLFSRRTRRWALLAVVPFHLTNHFFWNIGVFPWFMLAATGLFFEPDWPERLVGRWRSVRRARAPSVTERVAHADGHSRPPRSALVTAFIATYLFWQALFPLRHLLYPGSPEWNGQGSLFAWRMLAVDRADAIRVRVEVPGQGTVGYVRLDEYMNVRQRVRMTRMPKSLLRFAHFIRDEMRTNAGIETPGIYVDVKRRLNERPFQPLLDPAMNMASIEYRQLAHPEWLLPLDPELRPGTADGWRERERGR